MLHASCSKLIEQIITQSSIAMETGKADSSSRNVSTTLLYFHNYLDFMHTKNFGCIIYSKI